MDSNKIETSDIEATKIEVSSALEASEIDTNSIETDGIKAGDLAVSKGFKIPSLKDIKIPPIKDIKIGPTETREVTDRNEQRSKVAAGGWAITWGDLINEGDLLTFGLSVIVPGGTSVWVSEQVRVQLQKFSQVLSEVEHEVIKRATSFLEDLIKGNHSGEKDFDGLGVKAGFVTYHRHNVTKLAGKIVATIPLPNNHQPYIGLRITKPLPKT
jgi:hypothetical protein